MKVIYIACSPISRVMLQYGTCICDTHILQHVIKVKDIYIIIISTLVFRIYYLIYLEDV